MNISKSHSPRVSAALLTFSVLATIFATSGAPAMASDRDVVRAHVSQKQELAPDVGTSDEAAGNANVPAIAPDGTPTWPTSAHFAGLNASWQSILWMTKGTSCPSRNHSVPPTGNLRDCSHGSTAARDAKADVARPVVEAYPELSR
jgi:hypothetical protein